MRRAIEYLADTKERLASRTPRLVLQFIVMDENAHEEQAFIDYWQDSGHEVDLKIKPRTGWGGTVPVWSGMQPGKQRDRLPCTWLLRQLTVFWNGQVPQCDGDWNGPLARVRTKHFRGDYKFAPCHDCQDWSAGLSRTIHCGQPAAAARES